MNNNRFAMMRYFRDLGADAHLLLDSTDGMGEHSHFTPEADTWEIERWSPYIHQTKVPNALIAALDFPISTAISLWSKLKSSAGLIDYHIGTVSREELLITYGGYDVLIGSGISPAALARIGRSLDIFCPYSMAVEYVGLFGKMSPLSPKRYIENLVRVRQLFGISQCRHILTGGGEISDNSLERMGFKVKTMTNPLVYNGEIMPLAPPSIALADAQNKLKSAGISLLHHARLIWKKCESLSDEENYLATKNSDWVIKAFAALVAERPSLCPRLIILEYGPDVSATKKLVAQLGIQESVTWLPKMSRREIMWLLKYVSIGVGQFYNPESSRIWGGTGWETLASGKPLLQRFDYEIGEFEKIFGYPPPPMLPVRTQEDVLKQLLFVADHPEKAAKIGEGALEWFDTHNGINLSKKWLDLIQSNQV
jgi:glycosyltransferase involved in cell wall biosynthesis